MDSAKKHCFSYRGTRKPTPLPRGMDRWKSTVATALVAALFLLVTAGAQGADGNLFGADLGQFGAGAFQGLFGIQNTQDAKKINQQTPGNWTKERSRKLEGGEDPGGFWAPPPDMDWRSDGIHKDRPQAGEDVLTFWLTVPGDVKVGQTFDYGPWANYGLVTQAMMWDVNGYVMGGYTKTTREKVKVQGRHKLVIEKWDPELGIWNTVSERDGSGMAGFSEQGYYRLTVALYSAAFRLAPQYGTVAVTDPRFDRKGSEIYYEIMAKLPSPYAGLGMTIDGYNKPWRQFSANEDFRRDCGQYQVEATAKRGVVDWETNGSRMMKSSAEPQYYRVASWVLRGSDSSLLWKNDRKESFVFDANYWGDGRYTLETHLAAEHQGQGIQNMPVNPAITYITVTRCGPSRYKPPASEITAFEGDKKEKETMEVGNFEPNQFAKLDGKQNIVMVQPVPIPNLLKDAPADTPKVPVEICQDCPKLRKQIVHRTRQLQIPCDPPEALMDLLLKAPKRFHDMEADYAKEWNGIIDKIKAFRDPFTKLAQQYAALIMTAYKENLVISAEDQQKYRPMDKSGNPSTMGNGIPMGYFVTDKNKVALANQLRAGQKRIYEEWLQARLALGKALPQLKGEVEKADQRFEDYSKALGEMRADVQKMQTSLSDMYFSGKYEHCLGSGGQRTSGDYEIVFADGRREKDASRSLPGMNVQLPEAQKRKVDVALLNMPKPLHEIQPLKIKWDGIKQAESDRKLLQSLADAKMLQYEAENGTWLNWVGSRLLWVGELAETMLTYTPPFTGAVTAEKFMQNIAAGKDFKDAFNEAYKDSYGRLTGTVTEWGQKLGNMSGSYLEKASLLDMMKDGGEVWWKTFSGQYAAELVGKVFEGLGDDVAKYVQMRTDTLKELEKTMEELNELGKYGADSVEANQQRMALLQRQMELWGKMDEGVKAMDNLILTAATSNTALSLAKGVANPKAALAGLQEFLKDGMVMADKIGLAVGEKVGLVGKAQYLDDVAKAGLVGGAQVDDAIRGAGKILGQGDKLDDAMRAQQKLAGQVDDFLDDALNKARTSAPQPKDVAPPKQITLVEQNVGTEIGHGGSGTVKQYGDDVIKEFDRTALERSGSAFKVNLGDYAPGKKLSLSSQEFDDVQRSLQAKFQQELDGMKALREGNLAQVESYGMGTKKVLVNVDEGGRIVPKEMEVPFITKRKWAPDEKTLSTLVGEDAAKGTVQRQLTHEESIRLLESIDDMTKKGIVNLDPNAGNFLVKTEGGTKKIAFSEAGSVVQTGDPNKAREVMIKMLSEDIAGDPQWQRAMMGGEFEKIGGTQFMQQMDNAMQIGGATFKDGNVGRMINKDIMNLYKDQTKWNEFIKNYNRSAVVNNPAGYLSAEQAATLKGLQNAKAAGEQSLLNAANEVTTGSRAVNQQIMGAVIQPAQDLGQVERLEKAARDGLGTGNLLPGIFDDISFLHPFWYRTRDTLDLAA
jgi:hypothetical protein